MAIAQSTKLDYGVDAPAALRNLFLFGALCLGLGLVGPRSLHLGHVSIFIRPMFRGTGIVLLIEALLYLFYVKVGKFRHRDRMLAMVPWRGTEHVLDVGCGRGLLLAGAAKRLTSGHATGIDIWSNVDMGGNSPSATEHNLRLEGLASQCTLMSVAAQQMPFPDASFDVILSNLCLHNIYDRPTRIEALRQIARVLAPGGVALLSDYKRTGEYEAELRACGLAVERRRGSWANFPPLRIVVARKPC